MYAATSMTPLKETLIMEFNLEPLLRICPRIGYAPLAA